MMTDLYKGEHTDAWLDTFQNDDNETLEMVTIVLHWNDMTVSMPKHIFLLIAEELNRSAQIVTTRDRRN